MEVGSKSSREHIYIKFSRIMFWWMEVGSKSSREHIYKVMSQKDYLKFTRQISCPVK